MVVVNQQLVGRDRCCNQPNSRPFFVGGERFSVLQIVLLPQVFQVVFCQDRGAEAIGHSNVEAEFQRHKPAECLITK